MPNPVVLTQYSMICQKISALKKKNENVFERLEALEKAKAEFEQELKNEAREHGDMENEFVKVRVIESYRKWYDFRTLEKLATPKELNLIKDNAIVIEVLRPEFEQLVKEGKIDANLMQKSFMEEKITSKVSINEK